MDTLKTIFTRRSIRSFTGQVINDDDLTNILKAGFQAPSAHNTQPREYIVIKDPDILDQIPKFHPYTKMLPKAKCGIVVCGNKEKQSELGFLALDCAASIQNMLLAAHSLGLGGVWCGLYPVEELMEPMIELLGLPDHIIPISMVVVGVKDRDSREIDRYNEENIRYDKW